MCRFSRAWTAVHKELQLCFTLFLAIYSQVYKSNYSVHYIVLCRFCAKLVLFILSREASLAFCGFSISRSFIHILSSQVLQTSIDIIFQAVLNVLVSVVNVLADKWKFSFFSAIQLWQLLRTLKYTLSEALFLFFQ